MILLESLPPSDEGAAELRPTIWKLLLRLHVVPPQAAGGIHPLMKADTYLNLTQVAGLWY